MQCTAHRRDGEQCRTHAVTGTTVCRMHGGSAPAVKAAGLRRAHEAKVKERAAREIARLIGEVPVDPASALLELVHYTAGEVSYWQACVGELQEAGTEDEALATSPEYSLWVNARERLAQYAATCIRAGVEERHVRATEELGAQIAEVIRRILERLDLQQWQRELSVTVVSEELRRMGKEHKGSGHH